MPVEKHFWHPQPAVQAALSARLSPVLAQARRVVDAGAGYAPWPHATELVDIRRWSDSETRPVHLVDIDSAPLPFGDRTVDFMYTRHTLEDLQNPLLLCREMNRVARAGYIETPSPAAEFCRGVDANKPVYRGYIHHRYLIWEEDGTLLFLPKYPIIEYLKVDDGMEDRLAQCLNQHPITWNTYFFWNDSLKFRILRHDVDYQLQTNYGEVVVRAVNRSIQNALRFAQENGLGQAAFVPSR